MTRAALVLTLLVCGQEEFDPARVNRWIVSLSGDPTQEAQVGELHAYLKKHNRLALIYSKFEESFDRRPRDAKLRYLLGRLLLRDGNRAGALKWLAAAAQAEMEAIHLAAEFIRWCQDENVRQAAGSFITTCAAVARNPAQDLVADANALFNPSNAAITDIITNKLTGYTPAMRKGLAAIGAHVQATDARSLGHYGALVEALGPDAKRVLLAPFAFPDDPLSMATQIRDVFAGANAMARYVKEHYPTDAEKAAKDAKKGKKKGEE